MGLLGSFDTVVMGPTLRVASPSPSLALWPFFFYSSRTSGPLSHLDPKDSRCNPRGASSARSSSEGTDLRWLVHDRSWITATLIEMCETSWFDCGHS